jgi:hypothetical protein
MERARETPHGLYPPATAGLRPMAVPASCGAEAHGMKNPAVLMKQEAHLNFGRFETFWPSEVLGLPASGV